ncbi:MAG: SDR family oxidoreductase [Candidatus Tectomicrobia bacterium]|nr:SDR family oxidoreductase [Candidatus Tectomicrobia bacterium]
MTKEEFHVRPSWESGCGNLGRLTTADDLAKAIVWFASSESDYLTGQALNVNGGSLMS